MEGANSAACVDQFCSMCCTVLSKDVSTCSVNCNDNTKKVDLEKTIMNNCADQKDGENNNIKLNACKSCCESNRSSYITDGSLEACGNVC